MTSPGSSSRAARSSRQTESRPPESIVTSGAPPASSPSSRTRSSTSDLRRVDQEELGRLGEALEGDLADRFVAGHLVPLDRGDDAVRGEPLACVGAGVDAVGGGSAGGGGMG